MDKLKLALQQNGVEYKENIQLKAYTSFKIGGNADLFIVPKTQQEVVLAFKLCSQEKVKTLIIGNGSNMLVSDNGFSGAIIWINNNFAEIVKTNENTIIAQAGASLSKLCNFAKDNNLSGLEFAFGIPATIGGAVYMNAGAYGGEMKDVIASVTYCDKNGNIYKKENKDLNFSYRHSFFSSDEYCVLSAEFKLNTGEKSQIKALMEETLLKRKTKQPLEYPSAGSTFKRPPNAFAAQLIEECGLKGEIVGGAMVSKKHSGFIINYDNATCEDVLELVEVVKKKVFDKTGIELECEIKRIV